MASSGHSTNKRPMTLAEYDERLDKLEKENFNLKLRIWDYDNGYRPAGRDNAERLREYEAEITELKAKSEEKDRILMDRKADKENLHNELTEHINALEEVNRLASEKIHALETENLRLSHLVECGQPLIVVEHDADATSPLSPLNELIFELKTRVAVLERDRDWPSSTSTDAMVAGELNTSEASVNSDADPGETVEYEEIETTITRKRRRIYVSNANRNLQRM